MAANTSSLTPEQRAALSTRDVPVALSAGAGCGKTFVLTRRFLSYLEPDPATGQPEARLHEIVAITFTERAAREMRDRIRKACQQRVLAAPTDALADYWLSIVRDLESARIQTIHAFCGSLLRSHAVEAGLDPHFTQLDETESTALFTEVVDDHFREKLAARDDDTMDLVAHYGLDGVRGMVRTLVGQRDRIDFATWLARTPQQVVDVWAEYHDQVLIPAAVARITQWPGTSRVLELLRDNQAKNPKMVERRAYILEHLPKLAQADDPVKAIAQLRAHCTFQHGGAAAGWHDREAYPDIYQAVCALRDELEGALDGLGFDPAAALPAAEQGLKLLRFAEPIIRRFDQRKREVGGLDFDDLLVRVRDLICPAEQRELRLRIASGIKALLIDEFQDTDPLQVDLVRALCADQLEAAGYVPPHDHLEAAGSFPARKLFFVGDFKQSIYRFRRADPRVFRQLQHESPQKGRLSLTRNFRSQEQILAFVNCLFSNVFGQDYEPLTSHRGQVNEGPCIELMWATPQGNEEGPGSPDEGAAQPPSLSTAELRELEADWIARRLRQLLDDQAKIVYQPADGPDGKPGLRAVRPGDIAILFRALSDVAIYEQALERYGLDYYLVGGHAFYAQQEIFDLLNLLRSLAYPGDLVSLVGVLRSPFFSLSDETIFWLAQHRQGISGGLFDARPPRTLDRQQTERVLFAAQTLRRLRAAKDRMPVAELIQDALAATGYDATLLAEFLGERKLANLRKLIDLARKFDASGVLTLADFITQLSDFVAKQPDEPLAATHPEDTDVIRLMTIHQSKGLEFPVVVVPDLGRPNRNFGVSVAFDPQLGPLTRLPRNDAVVGLNFFTNQEKLEEEAERNRLLYVATTRAADYLILSSSMNQPGQATSPWLKTLDATFDLLTGKLKEKVAGREPPRITVTLKRPEPGGPPRTRQRPELDRLIEQAAEAVDAQAFPPLDSVRPVKVDAAARREFSFSRLSNLFEALAPRDEVSRSENGAVSDTERVAVETLTAAAEEEAAKPAPLDRDVLFDPRGLGTLVHAALEAIDFNKPPSPTDLSKMIQRLAGEYLNPDNPHAVGAGEDPPEVQEAITLVGRFLKSPRAKTLAKAKQVEREIEFLLAWPPEGSDGEESPRFFRGFIDCLYQDESGAWHLLDYKTNRVTEATVDLVARHYQMQMFVYSLAVEQVLGVRPASASLYFLRLDKEYAFTFTDQDRARMIQQVSQSMAQWVLQAAGTD